MKRLSLTLLLLFTSILLSACSYFQRDSSGYDSYGSNFNHALWDDSEQAAEMNDKYGEDSDISDKGVSSSSLASDSTVEVPFSASRKPGAGDNVGGFDNN